MNTFSAPCIDVADFTAETWAERCSKWASQDLTNWERQLDLELPKAGAGVTVIQTDSDPSSPVLSLSLSADALVELQDYLPAIVDVLSQLPTDPPIHSCDMYKVIGQLPPSSWLEFVKWQGVTFTHTGRDPECFQDTLTPRGTREVAAFATAHITPKGTEFVVAGNGQWDRLASAAAPIDPSDGWTFTTGCTEHGPNCRWAHIAAEPSVIFASSGWRDSDKNGKPEKA